MTPTPPPRPGDGSPLIHRQLSFTLAAFDRFKEYQRHLEATEGRRVTNSEALSRLILSHPRDLSEDARDIRRIPRARPTATTTTPCAVSPHTATTNQRRYKVIEHEAIDRDAPGATPAQLFPAFYAARPALAAIREDDCDDMIDLLIDLRAEQEGRTA